MNTVLKLLQSIPFLVQLYTDQYRSDDLSRALIELENDANNVPLTKPYDFIVVGGGSAGCVVAGRLSEKHTVLLLEAGGSPPPASSVPYFAQQVAKTRDINYVFKSVSQATSLNNGRVIKMRAGKMLGGSGSENFLVHNRGSPADYDNWSKITGDPSWAYANVYKYFAKSENFVGQRFGNNTEEFYGIHGPIIVNTTLHPLLSTWLASGKELGFPTEDPNGFQIQSFTPLNAAIVNGRRSSSYEAYIKPYEQTRKNLTVIRYANVSEILINDRNEAYGVVYTRHGFLQMAYAFKEVVLSAGVISSPLLLMKSGIGPVDQLEAAGIPVKVSLESVGKDMSHHFSTVMNNFYASHNSNLFYGINPKDTQKLIADYRRGQGIFTKLLQGPQCFVLSSRAEPGWPNLLIKVGSKLWLGKESQKLGFSVMLGRPRSRGSVTLNGNLFRTGIRDDVQLAQIDFNLGSEAEDLEDIVEGIKFVFRIVEETKAFQALNITYRAKRYEACTEFKFRSDAYWKCFIVQQRVGWIHSGGTCGMGSDASKSVLDSKLRVHGVKGLRVIDASIMPVVPNANLNAPVIMIAEKGADEILQTWSVQPTFN